MPFAEFQERQKKLEHRTGVMHRVTEISLQKGTKGRQRGTSRYSVQMQFNSSSRINKLYESKWSS